jgi:hypothetical protein
VDIFGSCRRLRRRVERRMQRRAGEGCEVDRD